MSSVQELATAVTLTGTYAVSTNTATVGGYDKHTLYVTYTPGVNSTNELKIQIEATPDDTNWYPVGEHASAAGTLTGIQYTLSEPSSGTSAQRLIPLAFTTAARQVRIKYKETNTPSPFGTVSAFLFSKTN